MQLQRALPGSTIPPGRAELDTLTGMAGHLRRHRTRMMCEVLRRDEEADADRYFGRIEAIQALMAELDYRMFEVRKSDDLARVTGIVPIDAFPREPWRPHLAECNDYLFLPAEAAEPDALLSG